MINQLSNSINKTSPLPKYNKGLVQARHLQAKLQGRLVDETPNWSPITAGPYIVPVTRWIE